MNVTEAKEILRLVFGAYPTQRQRMQPEDVSAMLHVWSIGLADVDFEIGKAAISRLVCTSKWMPSISEMRAELGNLHHGRKRHGVDAWGDLRKLQTYREREALADVDPLVLHVVGLMGWIEWRTLWRGGLDVEQWHVVVPLENESSDRARFIEAYDKLTADDRQAAQLSAGAQIPVALQRGRGPKQLGDIVNGLLPEKTEP